MEVAADETQVICMYEENVSIVNLGDGVSARQIFQDEETTEPVASFARHPANEEIVVATQKGALMHLNAQGEVVRTFKAHQMPILCMAYDPYGKSAECSITVLKSDLILTYGRMQVFW